MNIELFEQTSRLFRAFRRSKTVTERLPAGERLLDVNEAAAMLGLKPSTLYQWAYGRKIPVVKLLGRALRFRLSVIEKLISDCDRLALSSFGDREDKPLN